MSGWLTHRGLLLPAGGGGGGGTLYDEIMADIAIYGGLYFRHGEASGTTMLNAAGGSDGAYSGSPLLAQPALYTGGPTSFAAQSAKFGEYTTAMTGAPQMTLVAIVKLISYGGTYGGIISRDIGSGGGRKFHWRMKNTGEMEFVNVGYSTTHAASSIFTAGTPVIVSVTLGNTGSNTLHMYKNGVQVAVSNMGVIDWGAAGDPIQIGHMLGGFTANSYFSESAVIYGELSGARMAAYAAAAGF